VLQRFLPASVRGALAFGLPPLAEAQSSVQCQVRQSPAEAGRCRGRWGGQRGARQASCPVVRRLAEHGARNRTDARPSLAGLGFGSGARTGCDGQRGSGESMVRRKNG